MLDRRVSVRSQILGQFSSDIADRLMVFCDELSEVDTDIFVFMARKSYCLFDVMRRAGARLPESTIVSDRVLDFDLAPIVGRRLTLVDDTLFLGTTLDRTREQLLAAGASDVKIRVFCRNTKWHDRRVLDPDYVALDLDDQATRTFCMAAVRALAVAPRAYDVDFPKFHRRNVGVRELDDLLSAILWDAVNITPESRSNLGVRSYTFFPSDAVLDRYRDSVGSQLFDAIEVAKVRSYVRFRSTTPESAWVSTVPIVLLRPLSHEDLDLAVAQIADLCGINGYIDALTGGRAKLRVLQYWLSLVLGSYFYSDLADFLGRPIDGALDLDEANHHFGPWHADTIQKVSEGARDFPHRGGPMVMPETWRGGLPVDRELPPDLTGAFEGEVSSEPDSVAEDVIADFGRLFVTMYDQREIPTREDVLAKVAAGQTTKAPPASDRLGQGISFGGLHHFLTERYGLDRASSSDVARILSLILDVCHDDGIAVPIAVENADRIFRAYRHGEDVKFVDGELDLCYHAVAGFLDSTSRTTIPKLWLEKLLVILVRAGAARGFLEVMHGEHSLANIVEIQFDLKGAVPKIRTGPRRRLREDPWLSKHLLRHGVLVRRGNGPYALGNPVDGSFLVSDAPQQARELGSILGLLHGEDTTDRIIDDAELTVLATVEPPRDGLAALEAELAIVAEEYASDLRPLLARLPADRDRLEQLRSAIIRSDAYEAVHSARMKLVAIATNEHQKIVDRTTEALKSAGGVADRLLADRWHATWRAIVTSKQLVQERAEVEPLIAQSGELTWEAAWALMLAELSVVHRLDDLSSTRKKAPRVVQKMEQFHAALRGCGFVAPRSVDRIEHNLRRVNPPPNYGKAFMHARSLLADVVSRIPPVLEAADSLALRRTGLAGRREYSFVLWYDVVDSTATDAGRAGRDVADHADQVSAFRTQLNTSLQGLARNVRERDTEEVYAWNGDVNSSNDEKHVFFAGPEAKLLMLRLLERLGIALLGAPDVRIRMICVDAGFVGTSPYRYDSDTEVRSSRFWEHFSRVKTVLRDLERAESSMMGCPLAFVGEGLSSASATPPPTWRYSGLETRHIRSEAQFLARETLVQRVRGFPTHQRS